MKACNRAPRHPPISYNAISVSFTIISIIFVSQRLAFRFYTKIGLETDDYLMFVATIASIPLTVIGVYGLDANGLGHDVWTIPITAIYKFGKYFMIEAVLPISRIIWGSIAFCILQALITIFVTIFLCHPISYFWEGWDGEHTGRCLSNRAIAWANAVIGIGLDVWMLGIPLSQLRALNLTWRKKVEVGAMFSVGTFVTVVSVVRLTALVHFPASSQNSTWDYFGASVWSIVEVHVGILCTCMPTFRLFLVRLFPALSGSILQPSNAHEFRVASGHKGNGDQKSAAQDLSVSSNRDTGYGSGGSHEGDYDTMLAVGQVVNDEIVLIPMRKF
ncbi:hypothetical protein NM208_g147 [Fusarium decemcellulare]|uniref:Uncharacterized protein n=1 Tax=Fusarium decemcellulare TaxID=57161 RepID=A0ACC1T0R3_9HYPO|nr:hypothetical protein NM208_g147 [Fusarium decemcellulare]